MADLDRGEIVALLEQLGAEDDQVALLAARGLSARIAEAGTSWDELLRANLSQSAEQETPLRTSRETLAVLDRTDDAKIVDQLLARKGLSRELRDSLSELRLGISDGTADAADRRYVRALAKRLGI